MGRTYSADEVAAILANAAKKAAERSEDGGVTLAELEAAADEAGVRHIVFQSIHRVAVGLNISLP